MKEEKKKIISRDELHEKITKAMMNEEMDKEDKDNPEKKVVLKKKEMKKGGGKKDYSMDVVKLAMAKC